MIVHLCALIAFRAIDIHHLFWRFQILINYTHQCLVNSNYPRVYLCLLCSTAFLNTKFYFQNNLLAIIGWVGNMLNSVRHRFLIDFYFEIEGFIVNYISLRSTNTWVLCRRWKFRTWAASERSIAYDNSCNNFRLTTTKCDTATGWATRRRRSFVCSAVAGNGRRSAEEVSFQSRNHILG